MANALVIVREVRGVDEQLGMTLAMNYTGPDVGSPVGGSVEIIFNGNITLAALKTQVVQAVVNNAMTEFGLTVTGPNMIIPSFQKG